ncbi:NhaP-type Na+(K+)/H+ antiporter [Synechococcus sp. PCC 7502]|uniref:sodium:proton antiporter n=1 Tax=Synechococcus sp. PCC 7502 TaxID=1173263 RepID=UPI00029FFC0E|nr:sodium:proton antiporter [Synechococcus sp. PCC 7502]AFY72445.1 NhaP-type Na+(K+)/H+ antiporter [Synechococcus sp. PCC 7502]
MEGSFSITVLIITALITGVLAQVIANYFRVPSIVFLLILGLGLGRSGLGLIEPDHLDSGLEVIVSLAVALILFEGGFNLQLQNLGKVSSTIRNLTTIGTLISLLGGGIAAYYFSEFPWAIAFLYASLVVVTGPTVINPILKEVNLDRRLATILEGEGVLIDAVGAILAVVVLDVVLNNNASVFEIIQSLILRLGIGAIIGISGGFLLSNFLKRSKFVATDVKSSVVLAAVLGCFAIAQSIQNESGLMTAVLMGIVVRAASIPDERLLLKFNGQLTILMVSMVFVLLSANLSISSILVLGWGGVFTVLAIMLIVRPLNILVSTWNSGLNWRQKVFLAWCAPRGIVAASVASLFAIILTDKGINGGAAIKALVFLTIAMTVCLQGLTAKWLARRLCLTSQEFEGVVIVGCNPLGLIVAKLLQNGGQNVSMIDDSTESCKQAIAQDIPVIVGNAMDIKTLTESGLDRASTFIALTINPDINLVVTQRVQEEFRPPRVIAVYAESPNLSPSKAPNSPKTIEIQQAFTSRVPIKAWNQYLTQKEVQLGEITLTENIDLQLAEFNSALITGNILPIILECQNQLQIVTADYVWQTGDRIIYLRYTPKILTPSSKPLTQSLAQTLTIDVSPNPLPTETKVTIKPNPPDFLSMAREILKKY